MTGAFTVPVTILLGMSTKSVTTRAATDTCVGCVQRGLGRETPGASRCSRDAAEDDLFPHPRLQPKPFPFTPVKRTLKKDRDDIRPQAANIIGPVVQG